MNRVPLLLCHSYEIIYTMDLMDFEGKKGIREGKDALFARAKFVAFVCSSFARIERK